MALIRCVECGREISSAAPACPHCGFPRPAAAIAEASRSPIVTHDSPTTINQKARHASIIFLVIVVGFMLVAIVIALIGGLQDSASNGGRDTESLAPVDTAGSNDSLVSHLGVLKQEMEETDAILQELAGVLGSGSTIRQYNALENARRRLRGQRRSVPAIPTNLTPQTRENVEKIHELYNNSLVLFLAGIEDAKEGLDQGRIGKMSEANERALHGRSSLDLAREIVDAVLE